MKQIELSKWLRAIVAIAAACCALLAAFVVPSLGRDAVRKFPEFGYLFWPCLVFFWVTVLPVLAALAIAWRVFGEIGRDNSFSLANARRLRAISRLALLDTGLYILFAAALAVLGVLHPGVFLLILAVVLAGLALTVATAALSHLTRKAAALKDDSDLTI